MRLSKREADAALVALVAGIEALSIDRALLRKKLERVRGLLSSAPAASRERLSDAYEALRADVERGGEDADGLARQLSRLELVLRGGPDR